MYNYPDLFRDVASALRDTGYHREALRYWQPLKQVSEFVTATDYAGMAFCYKSLGLGSEAEACYRHIVEMEQDPSSTQPHLPLSTTLTAVAGQTTSDTMGGMFQQPQANEAVASETSTFEGTPHNPTPSAMLMPRSSKQSAKHRESERRFQAQLHEERLQSLYGRTQELLERARHGDAEALVPWMAATQELVDDFRSHRGFYPCDRSLKAYERSKSSATESLKTRVNQAMQDIIGQLERSETGKVP